MTGVATGGTAVVDGGNTGMGIAVATGGAVVTGVAIVEIAPAVVVVVGGAVGELGGLVTGAEVLVVETGIFGLEVVTVPET